jgi:hypothetical protein
MKKLLIEELSTAPGNTHHGSSRWFEFDAVVPGVDNLESLNQIQLELTAKIEAMDSLEIGDVPMAESACEVHQHFEPACCQQLSLFDGVDEPVRGMVSQSMLSVQDFVEDLLSKLQQPQKEGTEIGSRVDAPVASQVLDLPDIAGPVVTGDSEPPPPASAPAINQACAAAIPVDIELPSLPTAAVIVSQELRPWRVRSPWWKLAGAAFMTALAIGCWIAYSHRRTTLPVGAALQKSDALKQQIPTASPKQPPVMETTPAPISPAAAKDADPPVSTKAESQTATHRNRRVRIGENEIAIGEDVTVRYFTSQQHAEPVPQRASGTSGPSQRPLRPPQASISMKPSQ